MGVKVAEVGPHDIAHDAVRHWRGECLDRFSRTERAIGETLEALRDKGLATKLEHLAGQRTAALAKCLAAVELTKKQRERAQASMAMWQELEIRRVFLAHGVVSVALDRAGCWFAVFDLTTYKADSPCRVRWTVTEAEALTFSDNLREAGGRLASILGLVRRALKVSRCAKTPP